VADQPLGPYKKGATKPILAQNPPIGMYSTGHGSVAFSPDGREMYYVHHGRPSPDADQRRLYTERITIADQQLDVFGRPILSIDQATGDRPIPSGVAPFRLTASRSVVRLRNGGKATVSWRVTSADGVPLALSNPLNRVSVDVANARVAAVRVRDDGATITARAPGRTRITLTYQRALAAGGYRDVLQSGGRVRRTIVVEVSRRR